METCPNLNTVLQSFVDNSHYEMHFGVKANGDKVVGNLEEDDDGDRKSGHLLSFPITACNICVFVFVLFCFFKNQLYPSWNSRRDLVPPTRINYCDSGPDRAAPRRAGPCLVGPARPGQARPGSAKQGLARLGTALSGPAQLSPTHNQ